jgi:hypothetical protein
MYTYLSYHLGEITKDDLRWTFLTTLRAKASTQQRSWRRRRCLLRSHKPAKKAFKLRPKHVTGGRARQQIRTEIDLLGYGTAALVLRGSADPKDIAQAELIERFCMLNPELKDAAAAFFQRYIHDAGTQRPMDHLKTLCGFTDEAKPKPSGRSSL